jgi:hypothetical protein
MLLGCMRYQITYCNALMTGTGILGLLYAEPPFPLHIGTLRSRFLNQIPKQY